MPPRVSHTRGGGLPRIGSRRQALGDDAAEPIEPDQMRELEPVAEGAAGGEDRVLELERAELHAQIGRSLAPPSPHHLVEAEHRSVLAAQRVVTVDVRHRAAEAGAEAAAHRRLERGLAGDAVLGGERGEPRQQPHRPAGVEIVVGAGREPLRERLGDEAAAAGAAVFGGDVQLAARPLGESREPWRVGQVEAPAPAVEDVEGRDARQLAREQKERRRADATRDQRRRARRVRRPKPRPSGPRIESSSPGRDAPSAPVPRPITLPRRRISRGAAADGRRAGDDGGSSSPRPSFTRS